MFEDVKRVHLVGAGGIGVSGIGKYFLAKGVAVSGSDSKASVITDSLAKHGANVTIGHRAENVPSDCDLLVYTEAAGEDNVERVEAAKRGIRQLGHFAFLGELSKGMRTIAIAGTNGKSTTTAMLGKIFEEAGWDPTVFVGSLVPGWEYGNVRIGKSDLLVVEADEYKRKFLTLSPETTVITNIEEDHLDVYKDLNDILATFQKLVSQSKSLITNADDPNCNQLSGTRSAFGFAVPGDVWAEDRVTETGKQSFLVKRNLVGVDETLGRIDLQVPGEFNMMNALAAASVAVSYGARFEHVQAALAKFTGVWRRFERVGQMRISPPYEGGVGGGFADVISDYGHHPTAVRGTLAAAKEFFPGRRIVLCFQPHQHNRTRELFAEFTQAFGDADVLVLAEIYGVEGRTEEGEAISSLDLLNAIQQAIPAGSDKVRSMEYAKDVAVAEVQVREQLRPGDVVIVMGAGDIDDVARKLIA